MKKNIYLLIACAGMLTSSCRDTNKKDDNVISQRFEHKYNYPISEEEWATGKYPGTVTTVMRNGVTIIAHYDGGVLHGVSTHTYPHSPTIEACYVYDNGKLVKETLYDVKSIPLSETIQLSPTRYSQTIWFADGSPQSIEEYVGEELLEGQYFNTHNETESRVEKGAGLRVRRDREGTLLCRDLVEHGYMTKRENFYPAGNPESIAYYDKNKLHGEQLTFAANGEPLSTAEWIHGQLHGKCTFYKNGAKHLEVSYLNDQKNGLECHFKEGKVVQETLWENNKRHGETVYYIQNGEKYTEYYYDGKKVSYEKFKEMNHMDELVSGISSEHQIYQ